LLKKIIDFYNNHEDIDREAYGSINNSSEIMERYLFKSIEKLFKVISWIIYLSLITYLANKTHSKGMNILSLLLKNIIYLYITLFIFMKIQKILQFFLPKRESYSIIVQIISLIVCLKFVFLFTNSAFSRFMSILLRKFS